MTNREPMVVPLSSVPVRSEQDAPTKVRIARLITNARCGSDLLLGRAWMEPGQKTNVWSTEPDGQVGECDHHYGYLTEVYYVLRGRFRLTWSKGALEFGPDDAVYLAPGWRYQLENIGDEPGELVYSFTPTPE